MKQKTGLTATAMLKNWVDASPETWKHRLRKAQNNFLTVSIQMVVLLLPLILASITVQGQERPPVNAVKLTKLSIGDKVPDLVIPDIINYKTSTAKISDFKGKLLILDFWATWCGACIVTIPSTDSLQKQFEGKVQFLPIAYEKESAVMPFLDRMEKTRGIRMTTVVNDKLVGSLFPHQTLPHYVWIDGNGIVRAVTEFREVNATNIRKMLEGQQVAMREKKDLSVRYDPQKPLFVNNNGGALNNFHYRSIFTGYVEGLPGQSGVLATDSTYRILSVNSPVRNLFLRAYADKLVTSVHKIILEVKDTLQVTPGKVGAEYIDWLKTHGYTYELIVPRSLQKQAHEIMRSDLDRMLPQYSVSMEDRKSRVLVLRRTSLEDKLKSKGGKTFTSFTPFGFTLKNFPIQRLVDQLNYFYMQKSPIPVVNETGYADWVDMEIKASLSDPKQLSAALARYDLELVEAVRTIPRLVIRDRVISEEHYSSPKQ